METHDTTRFRTEYLPDIARTYLNGHALINTHFVTAHSHSSLRGAQPQWSNEAVQE